MSTSRTVPAGKYAKETVTNLKLWDQLEKQSLIIARYEQKRLDIIVINV